jgi:hypothetical protein
MISPMTSVIRETSRLRRRHRLTYDQTKYIVEQVRHQLKVEAAARRPRTLQRLDRIGRQDRHVSVCVSLGMSDVGRKPVVEFIATTGQCLQCTNLPIPPEPVGG